MTTAFNSSNLFAQQKEIVKEYLAVEELKQDFNVFRTSLEEGHPGLYLFKFKAQMDSIYEMTYSSITHQMTNREFMQPTTRQVCAAS